MQLKEIAKRLPDEVWNVFEPILPKKVWAGNGRPPASDRDCLHALLYVLISGISWELLPWCFPSYKTVQRRLKIWMQNDCFLIAWTQLAKRYEELHGINWDQILIDGSKKPSKKGGQSTGPSPVDRGKSGTASHVACDNRCMPLGVTVTKAGANDGCQTHKVLAAMVVKAPLDLPFEAIDPRSLPCVQADGAYGNRPSTERAQAVGFRLRAPKRGQKQAGVGKVRNAVERCHNFFPQFGRVGRRLDRSARRNYLGWNQMAACLIFIRSGFVR